MHRIIGFLAALAVVLVAAADARQIVRGRVVDPAGRAIGGAYVAIDPGRATTYSNIHGRFLLASPHTGPHTITVALVGFRRATIAVTLPADSEITCVLAPMTYALEGMEVTASSRTATDGSSGFALSSLPPAEVRSRAGAAEDVLRTLQSYPGVVSPNDFTTQLVVRGSSPEQNLIVMDGIEVINPYRLYGIVSMFNPQTVERIRLMTGGFPARYSDRLSAVVDVVNRDGSGTARPFSALANMSLTNMNLAAEGSFILETSEVDDSLRADLYYREDAPPWNGSWLISTRRTYYDLVAAPIVRAAGLAKGDVVLPTFQDFQFRLALQPDYRHRITFTGLTNRDRAELEEATAAGSVSSISLEDLTFNDVAGIQWLWTHAPDLVGRYQVSFTQNGGSNAFSGIQNAASSFGLNLSTEEYNRLRDSLRAAGIDAPELLPSRGAYDFLFRKFSASAILTWQPAADHTVEAGFSADHVVTDLSIGTRLDPKLITIRSSNFRYSTLPESFSASIRSTRVGLHVQDAFRAGPFTVEPGIRVDHFGLTGDLRVAPRLALAWHGDECTTLRATWGLYYQSPGYEKSFMPGYETYITSTTYDLSGDRPRALRPEAARHLALAWETLVIGDWQLRVEAYHKELSDLVYPEVVTGTLFRSDRTGSGPLTDPATWSAPRAVAGDSMTTVPVNNGTGVSYGAEIVLQKILRTREDRLHGWISYSYGKATRTRNGWTYPFDFDRRHTVNCVLGYRCTDWLDLSMSFVYGSGFPATTPIGYGPRIYRAVDSTTGVQTPQVDTDFRGVVFVTDRGGLRNINNDRLPGYLRCDVRATTTASWFGWEWSIYLDIMNISNHRNVALVEHYFDRTVMDYRTIEMHMLPILPSIGFTVLF